MPIEGESTYSADWLEIASDDFRRVPRRLAEGDSADAAFHLQQALEKYLKGSADVPHLDRIKVLKFIENMTMGCGAAAYLTESIHGAGSPQAQRIMIYRLADLAEKVKYVKKLTDLE